MEHIENNKAEQLYSTLPWYGKIKRKSAEWFRKNIIEFKIPWTKLVILVIIAVIIFVIYIAVELNQVTIAKRLPYDKSGFIDVEEIESLYGDNLIIENDNFIFTLNNDDTTFTLYDIKQDKTWSSNPDETSNRFLNILDIYYASDLGQVLPMGNKEEAVDYDDYSYRVDGNTIEILYEIGGKKNIDSSDFPVVITDDRMQELILSQLVEGSRDYRRVTEQAYVYGEVDGVPVWKLKNGIQTSILEILYEIFYDKCLYNTEELENDLRAHGIDLEDKYPYIEVSIKYELTENGLDIKLVNDSIVEKEKYPLIYIDVLPYFGSGSTDDEGYMMVPDGSGGLIDFNSDRSFALPYNKRIYGIEYAKFYDKMPSETSDIRLPVFGIKHNDDGFTAIIENGASMTNLLSNTSTVHNPYNQIFTRYNFREGEVFEFDSISSSVSIYEWTKHYNTEDFIMSYQFIQDDDVDYVDMANQYREYLVENGLLVENDVTELPTLDLTVLGGYTSKENFLGIPYETVRSLTNTDEVVKIGSILQNIGVEDINIFYKGFSNEGLKPSYMGDIEYDKRTGKEADFLELIKMMSDMGINIFPEVMVNSAYTGKSINPNKSAVRDVFGNVVYSYQYNPASLVQDASTRKYYTLQSSTYNETLSNIKEDLLDINCQNIAFSDFGNQLYGTYQKKNNSFRYNTINDFISSIENQQFNSMVFRNPNLYAMKYANIITDVDFTSSNYQIISNTIPFYQLVMSGYVDYSGKPINASDELSTTHQVMKMIETLSNMSFVWSYNDTIDLSDTEYSMYFSTHYSNWVDMLDELYHELLTLNIYNASLENHEFLTIDGLVTKSTYTNGTEIVFNYNLTGYEYDGVLVEPNTYYVVERGDGLGE